ncbi:CDP-alcohol phosphatidyltransferase family protein [Microbacterium sp.]|uniref:CDP-alcohol phosphatidyltransferase family protein n=1 Tax=Microbacterium sp. TaxID=51671 RepID=UPI003A8B14C5
MTFIESIRSLSAAQKSSAGAPAYSRFVNRPLGRVFAAAAHTLRMTPNQVTLVSALCTFSAIAMIATVPPTWVSSVSITVLLVLGYGLDSADGQLARLRGGGSPRGEWFDHMADAIKMSSIHLAVLICWARFYEIDQGLLLIPLAYSVVSTAFFFGFIMTDLLRRASSTPTAERTAQSTRVRTSPLYSLAVAPTDYGLLMLVMLLLWLPAVFVPVYAVLLVLNALILLVALTRWYRSLPAA